MIFKNKLFSLQLCIMGALLCNALHPAEVPQDAVVAASVSSPSEDKVAAQSPTHLLCKTASWITIASLFPYYLDITLSAVILGSWHPATLTCASFTLGAILSALSRIILAHRPQNKFLQHAYTASKILTAVSGIGLTYFQALNSLENFSKGTRKRRQSPFAEIKKETEQFKDSFIKVLSHLSSSIGLLAF